MVLQELQSCTTEAVSGMHANHEECQARGSAGRVIAKDGMLDQWDGEEPNDRAKEGQQCRTGLQERDQACRRSTWMAHRVASGRPQEEWL